MFSSFILALISYRPNLNLRSSWPRPPSFWPRSPLILASVFFHSGLDIPSFWVWSSVQQQRPQPIQNKGPPHQNEGPAHQKQRPNQSNFLHSCFDLPPIKHKCPAHQKQMPGSSKTNARPIKNRCPSHRKNRPIPSKVKPSPSKTKDPITLLCHLSTLMGHPTTLLGHPSTHRPPFSLVSIFMHSGIDPFAIWQRARSMTKVKLKPD